MKIDKAQISDQTNQYKENSSKVQNMMSALWIKMKLKFKENKNPKKFFNYIQTQYSSLIEKDLFHFLKKNQVIQKLRITLPIQDGDV